jgi:hypothetical protein
MENANMRRRFIDMLGRRVGRLVVVATAASRGAKMQKWWLCKCDCGESVDVRGDHLRRGETISCGCMLVDRPNRPAGDPERRKVYRVWAKMISRCFNKDDRNYRRYGARGITVCDRWRNSFESFFADMGRRPTQDHSIDRINNDGNYEPTNCRWATRDEQAVNRRTNRIVEYDGDRLTVSQWSRKVGIKAGTLRHRLVNGWSAGDALMTPAK